MLGHVNPMYYAVQASRSLASGTVADGTVAGGTVADCTVGLGFGVMAVAAALALWWGTRSYQKAMV